MKIWCNCSGKRAANLNAGEYDWRRQKGQRQGPETEGSQRGKGSKREEGQTNQKRTEIGAECNANGYNNGTNNRNGQIKVLPGYFTAGLMLALPVKPKIHESKIQEQVTTQFGSVHFKFFILRRIHGCQGIEFSRRRLKAR